MPKTTTQAAPHDSAVRAVVVVGTGEIPRGYDFAVVTERRIFERQNGKPTKVFLETKDYAPGADLYYRTDNLVHFPKESRVLTLGEDLVQHRTAGFSRGEGEVNVGPAHPAFSAANLAWRFSKATVIDIVGLSVEEQAALKPWFDELPNHPVDPASVVVSFS